MATTLTKSELSLQEFSKRVRGFLGTKRIRDYNALPQTASGRLTGVLGDMQRYARYNEEDGISYLYEQVCYGILWSVETGRVNGATHVALKALKVADLIRLVFEAQRKTSVLAEMPAFLMER